MIRPEKACAVVVTYNRLELLKACLAALKKQSGLAEIIVVDNASTDGTHDWLHEQSQRDSGFATIVRMSDNCGGAGGFSAGLEYAIRHGADWVWMMDDDAEPHPDALSELLRAATDRRNIYGSAAIQGDQVAWTVTLAGPPVHNVDLLADLPNNAEVESLPFLGFCIHREMVNEIGLPDAGFFIAADDIEYGLRAKKAGARLFLVKHSLIRHPRTQRQHLRVLGKDIVYLKLAPWKRYYDTRNRLLIARKYYGIRLFTQAVPGSFVRLFASLHHDASKAAQFWAWCCGMLDGLLGIKGIRHQKWGIRQ